MIRTLILLISTGILFTGCVSESIQRRADRAVAIKDVLGIQPDGTNVLSRLTDHDTVKDVRLDSVAVITAIELAEKYDSYRTSDNSLEELFPEGISNTTVGELSDQQLERYKKMVAILPQIVQLRSRLKARIDSFRPSPTPTCTADWAGCNYFFFNEANDLVSYKRNVDTYKLERVFKEFVDKSDSDKFYLSSLSEAVGDIDSLTDINRLYDPSTPLRIFRYVYHEQPDVAIVTTSHHSSFPKGANLYRVKKQTYVTSTRDGYNRLVEYANASDLENIDRMIVNGEISILNPDDKVMMIDCGLAVSKVKNEAGRIVFVDSGSITKIQ